MWHVLKYAYRTRLWLGRVGLSGWFAFCEGATSSNLGEGVVKKTWRGLGLRYSRAFRPFLGVRLGGHRLRRRRFGSHRPGFRRGHGGVWRFDVVLERNRWKGWGAYPICLPGCIATGKDRAEVLRRIRAAMKYHLEGSGDDVVDDDIGSIEIDIGSCEIVRVAVRG